MAIIKHINVVSPVMYDILVPYVNKRINSNNKIDIYILDITKYIDRFKLIYKNVNIIVFQLYLEHVLFNIDKLVYYEDMYDDTTELTNAKDAVEYLVKNDLDNSPHIDVPYLPTLDDEELFNNRKIGFPFDQCE